MKIIRMIIVFTGILLLIFLLFRGGSEKVERQLGDLNISGNWEFETFGAPPREYKSVINVTLQQRGSLLLGTFIPQNEVSEVNQFPDRVIRGEVNKGDLSFLFLIKSFPLSEFKGQVSPSGKELEGTYKFNKGNGFFDQPEWVWRAKKIN